MNREIPPNSLDGNKWIAKTQGGAEMFTKTVYSETNQNDVGNGPVK